MSFFMICNCIGIQAFLLVFVGFFFNLIKCTQALYFPYLLSHKSIYHKFARAFHGRNFHWYHVVAEVLERTEWSEFSPSLPNGSIESHQPSFLSFSTRYHTQHRLNHHHQYHDIKVKRFGTNEEVLKFFVSVPVRLTTDPILSKRGSTRRKEIPNGEKTAKDSQSKEAENSPAFLTNKKKKKIFCCSM